jgi:hypothetical protein
MSFSTSTTTTSPKNETIPFGCENRQALMSICNLPGCLWQRPQPFSNSLSLSTPKFNTVLNCSADAGGGSSAAWTTCQAALPQLQACEVALIANPPSTAAYTTSLTSNLNVVVLVLNQVWQWPSVVTTLKNMTGLQYLQASGQQFTYLTPLPYLPQLQCL